MSDTRLLLAVLIDADNIPAKHAEEILAEVKTIGEPALRRVYGDWTHERMRSWSDMIPSLGLVARQETANTTGKNASDIGLVIDAMDILHTGQFDGFVIVSSDSDFTALANRLREGGRFVVGMGEKKTPESLRNVCNRYIFIENITKEATPRNKQPEQSIAIVRDAIDKGAQSNEWQNLSIVGKNIMAAHPDFDQRTFGYAKLSELVENLPIIEMKREDHRILVRLKP
jgi:predicted nuclease of predicted toxin-antitoxin system